MRKPKLRISEKYSDGFNLEKILTAFLLPNTSTNNENHPFLIVPQKKGEKYAARK